MSSAKDVTFHDDPSLLDALLSRSHETPRPYRKHHGWSHRTATPQKGTSFSPVVDVPVHDVVPALEVTKEGLLNWDQRSG